MKHDYSYKDLTKIKALPEPPQMAPSLEQIISKINEIAAKVNTLMKLKNSEIGR